ncbi:hypothetical protein AJ78_03826 [Emergomyces pasteurianus Ep9510]|uniref:Uncharacterized protein n=1 Tax=Emergomyces pasteurianus Ep9510 TaxID=1447872 RepID=A0A1J9QL77_9EURO|nr:hypothetical protein AJ78_03826 [Emergomyces pasteurianus Ep9510]
MNGQWGRSLGLPQHQGAFTFSTSPAMSSRLSFSRQSSPPSHDSCRSKRPRPLNDVDGEGFVGQKKKRRLRFVFVTSRLSCPFSCPSAHIVSRGSSKIAVWAKQKALGRSLLRKAAIMNRIRKHALAACINDPQQFQAARQLVIFFSLSNAPDTSTAPWPFTKPPARADRFARTTADFRTPSITSSGLRNEHLPLPTDIPCNPSSPQSVPRRQYIPLPPSPLYLTNYDIFDNEDGYFDSDSDTESENNEGRNSRVYSDFNILEPSEPVLDDHDAIASFDSLIFGSQFLLTETLKEDEKLIGIRLEQERQKEVSFVHFGF